MPLPFAATLLYFAQKKPKQLKKRSLKKSLFSLIPQGANLPMNRIWRLAPSRIQTDLPNLAPEWSLEIFSLFKMFHIINS